MKTTANKTSSTNSISMVSTTNDDLKAVHSIEAILGIKNIDSHHQQHLFPSHIKSSSSIFDEERFGNRKRSFNEPYSNSKL